MTKTKTNTKNKTSVTAFKVFNPDWTCRGFQYEVGKTYQHKGTVELCSEGFHACLKPADCFNYYNFNPANKVAEVLLSGEIMHGDDKSCSGEITIVREIPWQELLELVNTGKGNTGLANSGYRNSGNSNSGDRNSGNSNSGYRNSGNRNSGYRNSGDSNSGDRNSGDSNSGDSNSGDSNSGDSNSGDRNSGNSNSGDSNSGNRNSGYGNSCDRSSGIFCSVTPQIFSFNKPTDKKFDEIAHPEFWRYELTEWISADSMSDADKLNHPNWESRGGYLKKFAYQEMWANGWAKDSDENKRRFFNLPNFDLDIFQQITGIDARSDYERLK